MKATNWIQQADQAMKRAAVRARNLAASTNTPLHLIRDGKIVRIMPAQDAPATATKRP